LINNDRFKDYSTILEGSTGLEEIDVPKLYHERRYEQIIDYVEREVEVFEEALKIFRREMPSLKKHLVGLKNQG